MSPQQEKGAAPVILVVDDESLIRWTLKEKLTAAGYDVLEAATGPDAVVVADARPVSLVLLDLALPGLDGLGVLEEVRKRKPWCPVILMTANDAGGASRKARALGAAHFVMKPFDFDGMVRLVADTLAAPAVEPAFRP